jgi:hypothetical protein
LNGALAKGRALYQRFNPFRQKGGMDMSFARLNRPQTAPALRLKRVQGGVRIESQPALEVLLSRAAARQALSQTAKIHANLEKKIPHVDEVSKRIAALSTNIDTNRPRISGHFDSRVAGMLRSWKQR